MVQALSLRRSSLDLGTLVLEQLAAAHLLTHEGRAAERPLFTIHNPRPQETLTVNP